MSAPFHFPSEYGKIGNWPGSLGPNQAQALFMEAVTHKKGAIFVELGFDGGRTTIVLNWAAREIEDAKIFSASVKQDETGLWFRRAQVVFKMACAVGQELLKPFPADMLVMNPSMPFDHEWIDIAPVGASIIRIGEAPPAVNALKEIVRAPGITIWHKLVEPKHVINRAIDTVVSEFTASSPMDKNTRAKIHSLRDRKERPRNRDGTDTELHDPVAADQGDKLLSR